MKKRISMQQGAVIVATLLVPALLSLPALAADDLPPAQPLVGEVRALAINPTNPALIAQLHQQGWLEARGQLLSKEQFPRLYQTVGRTWTSDGVAGDRFAIPDIEDAVRRAPSNNPFGVLGPGDLVSGGRVRKAWLHRAPLSYWIFVGQNLSGVDVDSGVRR
jgi:hypothetical protein